MIRALLFLLAFCAAVLPAAAAPPAPARFFDPDDGWLDLSNFLDTAYGFVPLLSPITEPAVGYGAVGSLVFIDRDVRGKGQDYVGMDVATGPDKPIFYVVFGSSWLRP